MRLVFLIHAKALSSIDVSVLTFKPHNKWIDLLVLLQLQRGKKAIRTDDLRTLHYKNQLSCFTSMSLWWKLQIIKFCTVLIADLAAKFSWMESLLFRFFVKANQS